MFAAIRGPGQDLPVLLHIVGATIVFGALLASATSLVLARGEARLLRLGYFSLLFVGLPALILMRLSAQWIYDKEGWDRVPSKFQPTWLDIGFLVADVGGLFFLGALAVGGIGLLRLRSGKSGAGLLRVTMVIALALIVAYIVAVWAMTGKPN